MCDFDYERLFRPQQEDDVELRRITEDFQRQFKFMDEEEDEMNKSDVTPPPPLLSSTTGITPSDGNASGATELRQRNAVKESRAVGTSPLNARRTSHETEPMEGRSFSSSPSRGRQQLTSSGAQTPTQNSNENSTAPLPGPAAVASGLPGEASSLKATPSLVPETVPKPLPPYLHQKECPPPYGWASVTQTKQPLGVASMPLGTPVQNLRAAPPTLQPSQLPFAAYAADAQTIAAGGFPAGLQARPVMLQPQPQQPQQPPPPPPPPPPPLAPPPPQPQQAQPQSTQSAATGTMLQSFSMGQQPPILPPPMSHAFGASIPQLQQVPQAQAQYVSGAAPPGYAQVLVPARTADGTTGYQLMMISTQHLPQGTNAFTPQLVQAQLEKTQLEQQQQQQQQQLPSQPQQQPPQQTQQPQAVMQYMWQPPLQAQNQQQQHPPQQQQQQAGTIPQQFFTPQYANLASTPQRYALVSANGQQQYVMALAMNPLQQFQQQQQQLQQHSQQFQQQPQPARPVYLTSQQGQPMFTTSMLPSGMPPGYRFN
ncbi:hypothetical protein TRSC58_04781 [Trypanosoma rangeli SC58]|uniref:Uncharacterized protein n=1 Tax=Trypanosoma rangeli SC58 TaxID=429131 RepID=A0A061IWL8_TRYRA|nr:hypothetical protein TRSC58_04781 [Trypanosoma rangeli SC58]